MRIENELIKGIDKFKCDLCFFKWFDCLCFVSIKNIYKNV